MGLLSRLADRLILEPTTEPIEAPERRRRTIDLGPFAIEAWILEVRPKPGPADVLVLKFPGTGGRAERGGPHPCDLFAGMNADIWTLNPAGYGGSEGRAALTNLAPGARQAWRDIKKVAGGRPILVVGNSLGCLSALYLAGTKKPAAVFLRNPPPLPELILGEYSWWNIQLFSKMIANQIPPDLNGLENGRRATAPAFFVTSMKDRVVPIEYQRQIIDAYGGPKRIFELPDADHHHLVSEERQAEYIEAVQWLKMHLVRG